jgi:hypothetical protein
MWERFLLFLLVTIFIGIFATIMTISFTYPFWSRQPIFHTYDLWRFLITEPRIIRKNNFSIVPKWYNPVCVSLKMVDDINTEKWYDFLQCHYFPDENILWGMPQEVWRGLLVGSQNATYCSAYTVEDSLQGVLISRGIEMQIRNSGILPIYYLDFFTIDHNITQKRQDIGYELLHTHLYMQQESQLYRESTSVTLFSKQGENAMIAGVVPIMQCNYVEVFVPPIVKKPILIPKPFLLRDSIDDIEAIYKIVYENFDFVAMPSKTQFKNRLFDGSTFIGVISLQGELVAFYIGKRSFLVNSETGEQSIELIGSWHNRGKMNREIFVLGWLSSLDMWRRSMPKIIIDRVLIPVSGFNTELVFPESPIIGNVKKQAWYLYNMYCRPISCENAFLFV